MRYSTLGILISILLTTGCESVKTRTDHDPSIDFSTYHSFAWVSDDMSLSVQHDISPLTGERIRKSVAATLTGKGFAFTEDRTAADFLVGFTVGSRDRVRVDANAYPVGFAGPYRWGRTYYQDIDVRNYTEGRLAIDVFDVRLKRPVWHGFATKSLSVRDREDPEGLIGRAVTGILADFPPVSAP
ncbi:MAG: DUF4136 domain-containing protein [Pseudomonadales bacterium]